MTHTPVADLLQLLARPEDTLVDLLFAKKETDSGTETQLLRHVCQTLFAHIEHLGQIQQHLELKPSGELSGLDQLYLGEESEPIDSETIWGQVDLQNLGVHTLVKQSLKRLTKHVEDVKVLDLGEVMSENGQEEKHSSDYSLDEYSEENHEEDDDAKRIRERMERAMEDMDDDDDEEEEEEKSTSNQTKGEKDDEDSLVDPAAEELNDGFFDILEMEDFADEEEEYLPEDAYGPVKPEESNEEKSKKSFHQRQRDGEFDTGSVDDEDDSDDDLAFRHVEPVVRRKKYREDNEVEALIDLYNNPNDEDDDHSVVNMTAADLFGKPNKKFFEKWKSSGKDQKQATKKDFDADGTDSWDGHNFDDEGENWKGQTDDKEFSDDTGDEEEGDDDTADNLDDKVASVKTSKVNLSKPTSKLARQTEELEQEMLAEKPWQMTGESKSTSRPVNSLLDSTPEFEVATKLAPIINVEHTANIEEVIKRRILAEDWDDVVPRELPDVAWNKKRGELPEVSQEKSKLGLGELYEREYLKKAVGYDVDTVEKETEEEKAKSEMKALFATLCSRLDALSNYHFAPRPITDEAEVRTVTKPAIAMEEVIPLHVSNARGVAPEEVYGGKKGRDGVLRGETEMDQVSFALVICMSYLHDHVLTS